MDTNIISTFIFKTLSKKIFFFNIFINCIVLRFPDEIEFDLSS